MTGLIKLYTANHAMLNCRAYGSKAMRKEIVRKLTLQHEKEEGLYFHIEPDVNINKVRRSDGMNFYADTD